jgi:hypothetical protein
MPGLESVGVVVRGGWAADGGRALNGKLRDFGNLSCGRCVGGCVESSSSSRPKERSESVRSMAGSRAPEVGGPEFQRH